MVRTGEPPFRNPPPISETAMDNLLTIVPASTKPGHPTPTMGTIVFGPGGDAIGGVRRIELVANVNDVWRARIDCLVSAPTVSNVAATVSTEAPLSWWRRLLLRLAGIREVDVTPMSETTAKHFAAVR